MENENPWEKKNIQEKKVSFLEPFFWRRGGKKSTSNNKPL